MKIYVVTHKKINIDLPDQYLLFQVGAAFNDVFLTANDAVGDNISVKNPSYCELTATYWIWKNDKDNGIVGLMHYRRFLTKHPFSKSPKYYLDEETVEKCLEKNDFIATKNYRMNVKEVLVYDTINEKDLLILRDVVARYYRSYLDDFDKVFNGKHTYICNIFIAKKPEWNSYCNWLFSILSLLENEVDMTGYNATQKRVYGYLAERLFTVYVLHNKKRVKSFRLIQPHMPIRKRIIRKFNKIFRRK